MRPIPLLAILLAIALPACGGGEPTADASSFPPCTPKGLLNVGEPLPDCRFEGLPGHADLALRDLKGKPVVLNFWAEWCPNCVKEMPAFQAVHRRIGDKVTIVGMDLLGIQGETKRAATNFATRIGVRYPLAFDPGGLLYGHFAQRSSAPLLPVTIFVDEQNVVRDRRFGELTERELLSHIRQTLHVPV